MVRGVILCGIVVGSFAGVGPVSGQGSIDFAHNASWLVGYVANAPQQMLGLGAWAIPSRDHRWGLYADAKVGLDSPARGFVDESMTPAQAEALGDTHFKDEAAWTTVNLALVRGLIPELAIYLGGGIAWRTTYVQYLDDSFTRGESGQYWVVDDDLTGTFANIMGGMFFRASDRIVFQFGIERAPLGATVGAHVRLR